MLGGKAAAQTGGQVQRFLGRLDDQRAGAAERVLHQTVAAHAAQVGNGSGQRLLDGGQRGVFAVAALVQAVAGGIEVDLHGILAQGKAYLVQCAAFRQGAGLVAGHQALDNSLFYDALAGGHAGKLAGQAGTLDREGRVGRQQFFPGDVVAAVEQFIKGGGLVGSQQQQHTLGGAQVQVGGGDDVGPALERHAAVGDLDVLGTQALDLKVQRGFGAEKARRHHGIQCRHKDPFVIIL